MSTDIIPYSFKNSYIFFVNCLIYFETVPWMPDFMQGMAKGIEKSRSLIQGAIKNVSGDMVINPNVNAMLNGNNNNSDSAISSSSNQNITYNFNQTNNSPKSLSRFEIYRQSKNLLSTVKGR